ncbi:MAG: hypothetical protein V2I62_12175 [Bacteroidales bacterium]|jgi:hypothetical protein|nr:hypothetical protein [Bacteroidales bacterium]
MVINTNKLKIFKTIIFTLLTVLFTNSCGKDDDSLPESFPEMTSITINGSDKVFIATVYFNEGVYRAPGKSGDLDAQSFQVELTRGTAQLTTYLVTHVAGQKNVSIRIALDKEADLTEILTIHPANNESIYNAYGNSMDDSEYKSIGLDGITHETILIKDDGNGTGTTTFTANNIYVLDGFVYVNNGQTLTIEAGTVIKGKTGQGEDASALIITRGGTLLASGTPAHPIIFTSVLDDLNGSVSDLDDGLWGGLIVLGDATINSSLGENKIEGIPDSEFRAVYGGLNDEDNSGVLRYISIRHGGTDIGDGSEINGLTLGGVGSETVIEFIEVFSNKDDGVEIFGGAPQLNNILVAFCGDDAFDYDDGFHGKGQFWIGIQGFNKGDRLGEHDGCSEENCTDLIANPTIYNTTYVSRHDGDEKQLITFRANSGGSYANSIFYQQNTTVDIEYLVSQSSYHQFQDGQLKFNNNIFFDMNDGQALKVNPGSGITTIQETEANLDLASYFLIAANENKDPGFILDGLTFDVIPRNNVNSNLAVYPEDNWFRAVNYKGAFNPSEDINWAKDWTLFSKYMN